MNESAVFSEKLAEDAVELVLACISDETKQVIVDAFAVVRDTAEGLPAAEYAKQTIRDYQEYFNTNLKVVGNRVKQHMEEYGQLSRRIAAQMSGKITMSSDVGDIGDSSYNLAQAL